MGRLELNKEINLAFMKLKHLNFYLLFVVLLYTNLVLSRELVLNNNYKIKSLNTFISTYNDQSNKVQNIHTLINTKNKIWNQIGKQGFKKKNDTCVWWLKFNVKCKKTGRYYLENQYPLLETFELFHKCENTLFRYGNFGLRIPVESTPKQKYPTFILNLTKGKSYTFYIKLYKKFAIPSQPLYLYSDTSYNELNKKDEREYGLIFGIILVLIFMGILTGVIFRLKIYFYYTFYMISLGGILLIANGLFRIYTPNQYLLEAYFTMYYFIICTFFALYLILYKLFDIRKEFPKLHKIIQWKIVVTCINMTINQIAFFYWPNYPLKLYEIANILLILYPLFLFGICLIMYKRYRSEKALYFLLLFTFTLIFTVFFSLLPFSFVSHNQLMIFRWIIVFEGIAVLLILHRDLYRSKINAIELQKNLLLEEKKSIENYANGLLDERNRIARELHDSISSNLTVLEMQLTKLNQNEKNIFFLNEIRKIQQDIRSTSHDLHPITLKSNKLVDSINLEIAKMESIFDEITFKFTVSTSDEFTFIKQEIKEIIYFSFCELVQNCLKHANATIIEIELNILQNDIYLLVIDNGIGYLSDNKENNAGIGLKTLTKRALQLNGKFEVIKLENGMKHVFVVPLIKET